MRVTPALRKQINSYIRSRHYGRSPFAEAGRRGEPETYNALSWDLDEDDLIDLIMLRDLTDIADDPRYPGKASLDLYVTTITGQGSYSGTELWGNVYAFIKDGVLAAIYDEDMPHAQRRAIEATFLAS